MHDIRCQKFNYKCIDCNKYVLKEEKKEHEKEMHIIIECKFCGL